MGIDQMLSSISRSAMRYPNEAAERHQGVIQPRTTMGVHGGESYERSPPCRLAAASQGRRYLLKM